MMHRVPVACSLTVLQVGSPQIFEPEFRPIAMLSSITFARLCLLSAPFIAGAASVVGEYGSLSIFGILAIIGSVASLLLEHRQVTYKCNTEVSTVDKSTKSARAVPLQSISISATVENKTEASTKTPEITNTHQADNICSKMS